LIDLKRHLNWIASRQASREICVCDCDVSNTAIAACSRALAFHDVDLDRIRKAAGIQHSGCTEILTRSRRQWSVLSDEESDQMVSRPVINHYSERLGQGSSGGSNCTCDC